MKTWKSYKKYFKYLIFVGLMIAIAGLVAGLISGVWSFTSLGLIIAGVIVILAGLTSFLQWEQGFLNKYSTQVGTNAIIATLAVFLILGLINFIAVRSDAKIDLTENQILTLADQSQEIVQNLDEPLTVYIFDRVPNPRDRDLLDKYSRYSTNFDYRYVNPEQEIGIAQEFGVQSLGEVYLQYQDKKPQVQTINQLEGLSEIRLTNAIQQVQTDRTAQIYFLQGHGEAELNEVEGGMSEAVSSLREKGNEVSPLNLAEAAAFPETADVIVLASPQRPLFPEEVVALQDYLNEGGNLLLLLDPNSNTGLDPILEEWGVNLTDYVVIDGSGSGNVIGLGPATPVITNYGEHPITRNFANSISFYPLAQPIKNREVDGIEATPLAITNQQSWGEGDIEADDVEFNPGTDIEGPLNIAMAFQRTDKEAKSRLVVFGNSTFATDGWFGQQLNSDIFLNSIGWLSQDEEQLLSIRPREPKDRRIMMNARLAMGLTWSALLIVPLLGLIAAMVVWWRRR